MKVKLEMDITQARVIEDALHLYARIGMGQVHDILYTHPSFSEGDYDKEQVSRLLNEVKGVVYSDLQPTIGHSRGIRSPEVHDSAKSAYDIYQVIRHGLAWHFNPHGNNWSVLYDEPTQFSGNELMKINIDKEC